MTQPLDLDAVVQRLQEELERAQQYADQYAQRAQLALASGTNYGAAVTYADRASREQHLVRGLQRILTGEWA